MKLIGSWATTMFVARERLAGGVNGPESWENGWCGRKAGRRSPDAPGPPGVLAHHSGRVRYPGAKARGL
jgi:hypothetical protein